MANAVTDGSRRFLSIWCAHSFLFCDRLVITGEGTLVTLDLRHRWVFDVEMSRAAPRGRDDRGGVNLLKADRHGVAESARCVIPSEIPDDELCEVVTRGACLEKGWDRPAV